MYILNIASTIRKMIVNKLRYFIFENFYKKIASVNKSSYYLMKRLKAKFRRVLYEQISKTYCLSYDYKFVCVDDNFRKLFKTCLSEETV